MGIVKPLPALGTPTDNQILRNQISTLVETNQNLMQQLQSITNQVQQNQKGGNTSGNNDLQTLISQLTVSIATNNKLLKKLLKKPNTIKSQSLIEIGTTKNTTDNKLDSPITTNSVFEKPESTRSHLPHKSKAVLKTLVPKVKKIKKAIQDGSFGTNLSSSQNFYFNKGEYQKMFDIWKNENLLSQVTPVLPLNNKLNSQICCGPSCCGECCTPKCCTPWCCGSCCNIASNSQ